ncbi:hypothetical protein HDU81_006084 [Chytriomyces hyalinus]|nr:hypothetical protein HDU81_006084 [Chytriomyces hyalinus]
MTTPEISPVDNQQQQQQQQEQQPAVQHVDEIADAIAAAAAASVAPAAESDSTTPSIPQILIELDDMEEDVDDDTCPEPNQIVDIMFQGEMPTKKNFGKLISNLKKTMSSVALASNTQPPVEGTRRKSFLSGLMGKGAVDESVKDEFGKLFSDLDIKIRV